MSWNKTQFGKMRMIGEVTLDVYLHLIRKSYFVVMHKFSSAIKNKAVFIYYHMEKYIEIVSLNILILFIPEYL